MSHVTDIILITSVEDSGIERVQKWLVENNWPKLVSARDVAGGDKVMQRDVLVAAINHFNAKGFMLAVDSTEWDYPESVQLLMKDEHDDKFCVYTVY